MANSKKIIDFLSNISENIDPSVQLQKKGYLQLNKRIKLLEEKLNEKEKHTRNNAEH